MRFFLPRNLLFVLALALLIFVAARSIRRHSSNSVAAAFDKSPASDKNVPLTASSFGFQCGTGKQTNCPNATWPTTVAQPGMIRLWDSQVQWHVLNPSRGTYNWRTLDAYLDTIAAHQPRDVMYTIGYTPCWATRGQCEPVWGSTFPPDDLRADGSPSFNTFITALVKHCSPAGHCVKDSIKYWELWNEANADSYWHGTVPQLYQLAAPAVAIIHSNVPGAVVLTPPVSRGDADWMAKWLNEENKNGRLSDIYSLHLYLQGNIPELRFPLLQSMLDLKNKTSGWSDTPWMNSETNFDAATFTCNSRFSTEDCIGQMVRWHIIQFSFGARQVSWYFFNTTIGRNHDLSSAYHSMMDWLVGGYFPDHCSPDGTVITCPFVDAGRHPALLVWNYNGDSSYTPAAQFRTAKDLSGGTTSLSPGQSITVGPKPIMLQASASH